MPDWNKVKRKLRSVETDAERAGTLIYRACPNGLTHPSSHPQRSQSAHPRARIRATRTKMGCVRFQVIKDGSNVRFYSRHGAEYTDRLPGMVKAFGKLPRNRPFSTADWC